MPIPISNQAIAVGDVGVATLSRRNIGHKCVQKGMHDKNVLPFRVDSVHVYLSATMEDARNLKTKGESKGRVQ
jgi:hypothetical protein